MCCAGKKAEAGSSVPCTHLPRELDTGVLKSLRSHENRLQDGNKNISSSQGEDAGFVPTDMLLQQTLCNNTTLFHA